MIEGSTAMRTAFATVLCHWMLCCVAVLPLLAAAPALGEGVALVTDVSGKVVQEGAPGRGRISILSEIASGARLQLEESARLTAVYLKSGDEYTFAGAAQIQFGASEPQVLSGASPQKRTVSIGKGGKDVAIKLGGVAQAGFVMRGSRTTGRIRLLTLAGTKTLESSPEFRWQETGPGIRYHFRLIDDAGKVLHETEVEGTTLRFPAAIRLREGVSYAWELSAQLNDGRRYVIPGDFSLASAALRAQVETLRPAEGAPVAERVLFAVWLERSELRDEARKYWKALAAERPDDAGLRALAGESTHPPRGIHDILALLDEYQPDPARAGKWRAAADRKPPETQDRHDLATFYFDRGRAARAIGRIGQTISDFRLAAEFSEAGHPRRLRILDELVVAENTGGNFLNALRLRESFPAGQSTGWRINRHAGTAAMLAGIGDIGNARKIFAQAEEIYGEWRRARPFDLYRHSLTAVLEHYRAWILLAEGKPAEAETAIRKAIAAWEADIPLHRERMLRGWDTPPPEYYAFLREGEERDLATILRRRERFFEAEIVARDNLSRVLQRVGRDSPEAGAVVQVLGQIMMDQGRYAEAAALARVSVDIRLKAGMAPEARRLAGGRELLATALVMRRQYAEAVREFEAMQSGLDTDRELAKRLPRGNRSWALALTRTGRAPEAIAMLEPIVARTGDRLGASHYSTAQARGFLAMALAADGQRERASREFATAIPVLLQRGSRDSGEEESAVARAQRLAMIIEAYVRLLFDLRESKADAAAEAFRLADAVRGQSWQSAVAAVAARAAVGDPALAELVRKEQDLRNYAGALQQALLRMLSAPPEQQLPKVISEMRERIAGATKERRSLFAVLEERFPAYMNLVSPRPATLEQARAALREGEVLLSVLVTGDRSYVWAVTKHGPVGFHAANLGEGQVSSIVAGLRKALEPGQVRVEQVPEFDVAAAHKLYVELLQPVENTLNGAHTLIVVANGALAQLPFTVLPTEPAALGAESGTRFERYRQVPWLVKQVAVTQLPAVSTLVTLRTLPPAAANRTPFAGFGDPQFGSETPLAPRTQLTLRMRNLDIPRPEEAKAPVDWIPYGRLASLPDTREEILAIAGALKADPQKDVFLGPTATKQNVKSADLSTRRIVAFATHGVIPGDFPDLDQPALALAAPDGRSETGLLTLEEILQLKLDADWVVLSACNTAAGQGAGAEAISGLGRGFFYAGSRALLVTHWPVETESARLLVTNTFERYANSPNVSRAEALKQASLALMSGPGATDPATNKPFSYAHPLFWAPYALVGDGGR